MYIGDPPHLCTSVTPPPLGKKGSLGALSETFSRIGHCGVDALSETPLSNRTGVLQYRNPSIKSVRPKMTPKWPRGPLGAAKGHFASILGLFWNAGTNNAHKCVP